MSTNKKREGINKFACDVSLYDAEKPKASMKYHKPPLPIILLGIVANGFVGQPFSKQLYMYLRCFRKVMDIREFKQTKTAKRMSLDKRFNEQDNAL